MKARQLIMNYKKLLFITLLFLNYGILLSTPTYITKQMIQALNPSNFKMDFSDYDQKTSLYCAHLSDVAYLQISEISILEYLLNIEYGKNTYTIQTIETSVRSKAVLVLTSNYLVISFRGTEFNKIKDIITDVKYKTYKSKEDFVVKHHNLPTGHAGFRKGIIELSDEGHIFEIINSLIASTGKKSNNFPIYLTGHSMGAGYSSLFVKCLTSDSLYSFKGSYNFAPPLAIYCPNAKEIRSSPESNLIYDIVNYKDYIARAGWMSRKKYLHIGKFYRISVEKTVYKENEHYVKFEIFTKAKSLYKYHSLSGYISALSLPINSETKINERASRNECTFCDAKYHKVECNE